MKNYITILSTLLLTALFSSSVAGAQSVTSRRAYRSAVKYTKQNKMSDAEQRYRAALQADSTLIHARYGLAGTLYEQGKYDEAIAEYGRAAEAADNVSAEEAAALFHNVGDAFMKKKDYAKAAESFKQSLRLNPTDDETRYNLALALKLMPKQNNSNGGNNAQPQETQPQQQQQKPQSNSIDKQTASQILESFREDDDQTRRRVEQENKKDQPRTAPNAKPW